MTENLDYPVLTPDEEAWRPRAANDVMLSDRDLAKLGYLAQLETQSKSNIAGALKGVERLGVREWRALDAMQFKQLMDRLTKSAAGLDDTLTSRIAEVSALHTDALKHRHQNLHSHWAWNSHAGQMMAFDPRRAEKLSTAGLDSAMQAGADLTFRTKACLVRVGELIRAGTLPGGEPGRGIQICIEGDEWVAI